MALPTFPVDGKIVMTSKEILDLDRVPESLVVIGGGVIGLEMGMVFLKLGSKLTVVELTDALLPGVDPDAVKVLEKSLAKRGATILKSTKAGGLVTEKGRTFVTATGADGTAHKLAADVVLVAVGFKPNSNDMGLEAAGVKTDARGSIPVDEHRRTNVAHVYAIGDVAGLPWLAHKASKEGIVAAEHASGKPSAYDVKAMPAGIFTDPEIGTVGLQEHEAKAKGIAVRVGKFPFTALGKALAICADRRLREADRRREDRPAARRDDRRLRRGRPDGGGRARDRDGRDGRGHRAHRPRAPDDARVVDGGRRGGPQARHPHPQRVTPGSR